MRIAHYLNQFFGGIGGEEKAGVALSAREGAVGPGRLLEELFGGGAKVVLTLVCGDNYAVEHREDFLAAALPRIAAARPDLFVAGPCFEAGRYGVAAGALAAAVQSRLGIPATAAMTRENPGAELYRESLYIVETGRSATEMREAMAKLARLGRKLAARAEIGPPEEEGYIPRGLLRDRFVEKTAAARLVEMLLKKVRGEPFASEMVATAFAPVPPPPPPRDLARAKIMLVTDGGLVPKGNPDRIEGTAATRWGAYDISGRDDLKGEDYEISHGGYDPRFVREDPDRLVPLDALRELEREGVIGKLHDEFVSTSGLANPISNTRRLGREIAAKAKREGVDAVILTST
jgi:betaine reductase